MNELRLWIAIGLSALAILLTVLNYLSSRRQKGYDMFLALWQEYGSQEMLECLQAMYRLWKSNGGDPDRIVNEYVERVRNGDTELHNQRRRVSFLFQRLAFLYYHDLIPPEFRREWLGFSLEVIAVLMPIEAKALPQIVDGPQFPPTLELSGVKSLDFRRMFRLYNEGRRA